MAALLATREDIDATLDGQRPPYKPPGSPHCYASDLKVPRSHKEAVRTEHAHLWKDLAGGGFTDCWMRGLLEQVYQPVGNYINAMWVGDWKADEYGWPTKPKARLVARGGEKRLHIDFGE